MILQIYRERVLPGREADFAAIEEDTARLAATLGCPNPYFAAETVTGPKVVWWFNAYESPLAQRKVAESYMKNAKLMDLLQRNSAHKADFTSDQSDTFAHDRPVLSNGPSWTPGHGRFLRVTETKDKTKAAGAVFETDDGRRFVVAAFNTREEAAKGADANTQILAVRPSWSFPAKEWIAADPEFWAAAQTTHR